MKEDWVSDIMRIVVRQTRKIAPEVGLDENEIREMVRKEHPEWLDDLGEREKQ